MIFTKPEQKKHRAALIEECRQKAWNLACHADWVSTSIDQLIAYYTKLQTESETLHAEIKELEIAIDYHTVDNREKRKAKQERRNQLTQEMKVVAENAQKGQQSMGQLLQGVESALALAAHAEKWEWKEVEAGKPENTEKQPG